MEVTKKRLRRHRVTFQRPDNTGDGYGGRSGTWVDVLVTRCEIERAQSFRFDVERVAQGGERSTPTVRLWIDYTTVTAAIDHTYRAINRADGTVYNVNFVQDLEGRQRTLCVTATENMPS